MCPAVSQKRPYTKPLETHKTHPAFRFENIYVGKTKFNRDKETICLMAEVIRLVEYVDVHFIKQWGNEA
jgi:hypothetical protein